MSWPPRCRHCGEPIGVYEPLIALVEGRAHETSRAAGHRSDDRDADCYHRACYESRQGDDAGQR